MREEERSKRCRPCINGVERRLIFHRYIYYRHHNIITYYTMFLLLFSHFTSRVFFEVHKNMSERHNGYELYAKRHILLSMNDEEDEDNTIKIAPVCLPKKRHLLRAVCAYSLLLSHSLNLSFLFFCSFLVLYEIC